MRIQASWAVAVLLCGLAALSAQTQEAHVPASRSRADLHEASQTSSEAQSDALTLDDRLSLIAAALDGRSRRVSEADCSHLVHAIYEKAGFAYSYAPSSELYAGADGFERVKSPEPGDLVVWRGHVGIVIKPSQHVFFSFLSSGPGVDDYQAPYWKHRGKPRFYRYVKTDSCCDSPRSNSHRLVKIKK